MQNEVFFDKNKNEILNKEYKFLKIKYESKSIQKGNGKLKSILMFVHGNEAVKRDFLLY